MSIEKEKQPNKQGRSAATQAVPTPPARPFTPPLFRRIDWLTFGVTTLLVFIGYYLTLAPDVTLEDSGELAVGSYYAGVPHPPGYPVWTIFTWLFTVLLPFSNIAWRVAVASAVSGALACGLIALICSRGGSMILKGMEEFKSIHRRWENALCVLSGYVAGMLIGFNGFMWSQAVIVEVYPFSLLSFVGVLCCLLRWIYAPHQERYLYWALFLFGVCFTNHQTLIVAAMGIEVAIAGAKPKLGRDLFLGNSLIFLLGLILKANGKLPGFENNPPLFAIYIIIGIGSMVAWLWMAPSVRSFFCIDIRKAKLRFEGTQSGAASRVEGPSKAAEPGTPCPIKIPGATLAHAGWPFAALANRLTFAARLQPNTQAPGGGRISRPNLFAISITRGMSCCS